MLTLFDIVLSVSADVLRDNEANRAGPPLRSGLYIFGPHSNSTLYVLYWPEDTTWKDDAISSIQRNRVTFMRYPIGYPYYVGTIV